MNTEHTVVNKDDLTPWFDGTLYKPARPGVYVSKYKGYVGYYVGYRLWTEMAWGFWFWDLKDAVDDPWNAVCAPSAEQDADWRGLRMKP